MKKKTLNLKTQAAAFLLSFLVLLLSLPATAGEEDQGKGFVILTGNLFSSSDANFRDLYSGSAFLPEIRAGYKFYRDFYAWAGFGFFSGKGMIEVVEEETSIKRQLVSLGAGYMHAFTAALALRGELGLLYAAFQETAFDETYKGSGIGWKLAAALDYTVWNSLFLTLNLSYCGASHQAPAGKLKLGGLQAGAGIGYRY